LEIYKNNKINKLDNEITFLNSKFVKDYLRENPDKLENFLSYHKKQ